MYENRGLITEIIILSIFLIIVVPICVDASNKYISYSSFVNGYDNIYIDISNDSNNLFDKVLTISNSSDISVKVSLVFKITKSINSYILVLEDICYNLSELEYSEDEDYLYYNLGLFDILDVTKLRFRLVLNNGIDYDENLRYSFIVKGL